MSRAGGSEGRVPTPPGHGGYYGARLPIHPEVRTDLETRKRELRKDPDWGSYTPMARQTEVGIYSTGVPRTRFKRVQEQTPKLEQVKVNYGLAPKRAGGTTLPELQELSASESAETVTKLPALATLTPEQEAMEARPFLPPPTPERKEKLPEESLASKYRRLKYDLSALKQKASAEIEMANAANAKLQRKVGNQKELLERQSMEIRELTFQLDEMRRMQKQEVQQEAKKVSSSEKRAAALHRKLGDLSHQHETAMSAAAASMRELQKERDAMAMGLAAVATQALGGEEADPQSISREVDASVKEGNDPLPRTPQSWLHFKYIDVSEQSNALRHRKLQGDGVRAVAALVAQVRRLWRKRVELGSERTEAMHEVEKLTHIIQKVDVEYQAISDTVGLIERAAEHLRETRGMDLPIFSDGTMPERLRTVQAVLHSIATELDVKERELGNASAKLLEMEFYDKLHAMDKKPRSSDGQKEEDASDEALPELSGFTAEDEARIVKMQAVGRGYIARKEVASKRSTANRDDDGLPDLSAFSEEDRAKVVKMQAAGRGYIARKEVAAKRDENNQVARRGMASRKSAKSGAQLAEAEPNDGLEAELLPDLSKFTEEEQAKIIKMQAAGRGYIARKEVAARQQKGASKPASPALDEVHEEDALLMGDGGLPDLSHFTEEERAKIIKIQAAGRGYIARKEVAARHPKPANDDDDDESPTTGDLAELMPDLSKFSDEERAKIVKMQAAGRGYLARKEVAERQQASRTGNTKGEGSGGGSDGRQQQSESGAFLPDLSAFSEEEHAKIVKMQAAGRGYIARKEVAARKEQSVMSSAAEDGGGDVGMEVVEAGREDGALPDLSEFSEEEQAKIVKMQAVGRGYLARKEVAARQNTTESMPQSDAIPSDDATPREVGGADELPDLSQFSEEEQAKIVKMQAVGRGYIARKEVAARKEQSVMSPVAEDDGGDGGMEVVGACPEDGALPDLSDFSEEEQAKIVKMQAVGRGYLARKEVAARQNTTESMPQSDAIPSDDATPRSEVSGADELPDLSEFSEEEQAKIVKMQAVGRGYLARKEVAARQSSGDVEVSEAKETLPDLSGFTEEERAQVVKMQAVGRGYIARKEVAAKKAQVGSDVVDDEEIDALHAPSSTAEDSVGDDGGEEEELPDLDGFSAADEARIVKIQSVGRGYLARREVEALKQEMDAAGGWMYINLPDDDPIPSLYPSNPDDEIAIADADDDGGDGGQLETEEAEVPPCIEYDGDESDDDFGSLPSELPHTPMTPSDE